MGDDGKRQAVIRTVARRGLTMAAAVGADTTAPARDAQVIRPEAGPPVRYTGNGEGHTLAYTETGANPLSCASARR